MRLVSLALALVALSAGCSSSAPAPGARLAARSGREPVRDVPAPSLLGLLPEPPTAEPVSPLPAPEPEPPPFSTGALSQPLSCGLFNPMPKGVVAGYHVDTGLDIAGMPSPVHSIASGRIVYAEGGHTRWKARADSPYAVLVKLDAPIPWQGRSITHAWYAHLSSVEQEIPRDATGLKPRVRGGEKLGVSGRANGVNHLHLGLLLDGDTRQYWGSYLLEDEVRKVVCNLRHMSKLPA